MLNLVDKNLFSLSNNYYILSDPALLNQTITSKTTIIYFDDAFVENNVISELVNNELVEKFFIISSQKNKIKCNKIFFLKKFNKKIIKCFDSNIIILINPNNSYEYSKFIVKNLIGLFGLASNIHKSLSFSYNNCNIICSIFNNNTKYFYDLINCINALLLQEKNKQYEFIYDTVCDYLDNQFNECNLCDFKNNQCIANRNKTINHSTMGCCYSFEYASFWDLRGVKNVQVCKYLQNKACTTKNISCKLFTCKYLKDKKIKFDTHKILLLDCFFNRKQHDIIQSNFFKKREEILGKLQEKNNDIYFWYLSRKKYMI